MAQVPFSERTSFRSFGSYDARVNELREKEVELGLAPAPKDTERMCRIVWLDVCAGRAGLVCAGYEVVAGASGKERAQATKRTAEEVSFTMPPHASAQSP